MSFRTDRTLFHSLTTVTNSAINERIYLKAFFKINVKAQKKVNIPEYKISLFINCLENNEEQTLNSKYIARG